MAAPMENFDHRDPLFKGCTRPAMVFGVPLVPLAAVAVVVILISVWTTIFFSVTLIPIILVMRQITKSDDQQFRLLWLKAVFRIMNPNRNAKFWKASTYSPISFQKRK